MHVGHIVNHFDPACDVLRCVRELNLYSRHSHSIFVRDPHPLHGVYRYEQPDKPGWEMTEAEKQHLTDSADVLIYHFAGWELGIRGEGKPSAFRNLNIYYSWEHGHFWSDPTANAHSYDNYDLLASSHVGAKDFMPNDRFRWLPDLLPLDGAYSFDPTPRPQSAISYIKHADRLQYMDFGPGIAHLNCDQTPHAEVLEKRRTLASVVIDNVSDGHYGLAGQEAAILGLPVVGFMHEKTMEAMFGTNSLGFPFVNVDSVPRAVETAKTIARWKFPLYHDYRRAIRRWAEEYLDPVRLIEEYWEPFIEELAS